jgi:hypothetical protein
MKIAIIFIPHLTTMILVAAIITVAIIHDEIILGESRLDTLLVFALVYLLVDILDFLVPQSVTISLDLG